MNLGAYRWLQPDVYHAIQARCKGPRARDPNGTHLGRWRGQSDRSRTAGSCRRFYFRALSALVLASLQSGGFGDYGGLRLVAVLDLFQQDFPVRRSRRILTL